MDVVLFGPPGAGKGTQSISISEKFDLKHVSTGDLFREAIKNETEIGKKAKSFMDRGDLVPDSLVLSLIGELMSKVPNRGLLLDGFPRNISQGDSLEKLLNDRKRTVNHAVFLEVPRELLIHRLAGRRSCSKCKTAFHLKFSPSKVQGVCDKCEGTLEQRKDDKEDVISSRLDVYEKNTFPLKDYYEKVGLFHSIDGVGEPEEVFVRICKVLEV